MLEVPIRLGSTSFQSKDVSGHTPNESQVLQHAILSDNHRMWQEDQEVDLMFLHLVKQFVLCYCTPLQSFPVLDEISCQALPTSSYCTMAMAPRTCRFLFVLVVWYA
ncbi:hypothetical protein ALC56_02243 [Trachymyrmex septentrionalis]|uniref:Uncharacterized protein n=1 Tax=Trachymyrmex septentrionalis TaxID=34720 RepID=A0A195FRR5_9HYME|nr:hypothetical protein ALC56_02243 [Trachymyrmex septentrionalis]